MDNEMRARLDGKQLVLTCAKFFTADQRERERLKVQFWSEDYIRKVIYTALVSSMLKGTR